MSTNYWSYLGHCHLLDVFKQAPKFNSVLKYNTPKKKKIIGINIKMCHTEKRAGIILFSVCNRVSFFIKNLIEHTRINDRQALCIKKMSGQ